MWNWLKEKYKSLFKSKVSDKQSLITKLKETEDRDFQKLIDENRRLLAEKSDLKFTVTQLTEESKEKEILIQDLNGLLSNNKPGYELVGTIMDKRNIALMNFHTERDRIEERERGLIKDKANLSNEVTTLKKEKEELETQLKINNNSMTLMKATITKLHEQQQKQITKVEEKLKVNTQLEQELQGLKDDNKQLSQELAQRNEEILKASEKHANVLLEKEQQFNDLLAALEVKKTDLRRIHMLYNEMNQDTSKAQAVIQATDKMKKYEELVVKLGTENQKVTKKLKQVTEPDDHPFTQSNINAQLSHMKFAQMCYEFAKQSLEIYDKQYIPFTQKLNEYTDAVLNLTTLMNEYFAIEHQISKNDFTLREQFTTTADNHNQSTETDSIIKKLTKEKEQLSQVKVDTMKKLEDHLFYIARETETVKQASREFQEHLEQSSIKGIKKALGTSEIYKQYLQRVDTQIKDSLTEKDKEEVRQVMESYNKQIPVNAVLSKIKQESPKVNSNKPSRLMDRHKKETQDSIGNLFKDKTQTTIVQSRESLIPGVITTPPDSMTPMSKSPETSKKSLMISPNNTRKNTGLVQGVLGKSTNQFPDMPNTP